MQKKLFLQKNLRAGGNGGPSHLKYLLWAALALILLVIVTPYLIGQRAHEPSRKLVQQEKGAMKKELPKPPEAAPGENPADLSPTGMVKKNEPAPVAEPAQTSESMNQAAQQRPAAEPSMPPLPDREPSPSVKSSEPASRDLVLFPKGGGSAARPSASAPRASVAAAQPAIPKQAKPAQPVAPAPAAVGLPGQKAKAAVPAAAAGAAAKQMYAVQVGCFKDKKLAEELQGRLKKKGYEVVISPPVTSGGGAYAVATRPVDSLRKASTLVEQLKNEQKTSPVVVKIPPASGSSEKPVPKAAAAKKAAAR